jgi:hypothetical protein
VLQCRFPKKFETKQGLTSSVGLNYLYVTFHFLLVCYGSIYAASAQLAWRQTLPVCQRYICDVVWLGIHMEKLSCSHGVLRRPPWALPLEMKRLLQAAVDGGELEKLSCSLKILSAKSTFNHGSSAKGTYYG